MLADQKSRRPPDSVLDAQRARFAAPLRTPVGATRAQTKDRVVLLTRSLMLKWQMMRMRSDFGLPIGTEHAHHPPKQSPPEVEVGAEPTAIHRRDF